MHPEGLRYLEPDFSIKYPRTIPEVNSLTPVFKWESLQNYFKRNGKSDEYIRKLSNIVYDIKIIRSGAWEPEKIDQLQGDYARYNLTSTSHVIEQSLLPGETYVVLLRCFYQTGKKQNLLPWAKFRGTKSEWEHFLDVNAFLVTGFPLFIKDYGIPYFFRTPSG